MGGKAMGIIRLMKHVFLSIILSLLLLQPTNCANALEGLIKFEGKPDATVFLEVADTADERSLGLMNRESLEEDRGMVFVFRPEHKVTFWMKDTLISLDMIFINNGTVVHIVKNAIPNQTETLYPSGDKAITEVVEVNAGFTDTHGIEIGSSITFENIASIDYSEKSELMIVAK